MRPLPSLAALTAVSALAACAQSDAALELANKTNAAALSVKIQIEDFAATQRRISIIETDRLGHFLAQTVDIETDLGGVIAESASSEATLYRGVKTRAIQILATEAKPAQEAAKLRSALEKDLEDFTPPSQKVDALSADLTVLGEEKSFKDQIDFFVAFGTSVKEAIDQAKAERDQALKQAGAGN